MDPSASTRQAVGFWFDDIVMKIPLTDCGGGKVRSGGGQGLGLPVNVVNRLFCHYRVRSEQFEDEHNMSLRDRLSISLKEAMRAKDATRLMTLRLINAAIKDRDIDARSIGNETGVSDADLLAILSKMVKQRQESARAYEEGGRLELAEQELSEITIVEEFLPRQLSSSETEQAIADAIAVSGANSIRDMGKVMGVLKEKYTGQLDFGKVGGVVKAQLS